MSDKPIAAGKSSFDLIDSQKLFSELPLKEGITFLDVACGVGKYSIALSEHIGNSGTIYAVDLWKEGIDSLTNQNISNIRAFHSDVSKNIPVPDKSIDICLMATVLHDLVVDKSDDGTLKEVKRAMKPDGTLAIVEFRKIEGPPGPPIHIRLSHEDVETMLKRYDFKSVKTLEIGEYNYLSLFEVAV